MTVKYNRLLKRCDLPIPSKIIETLKKDNNSRKRLERSHIEKLSRRLGNAKFDVERHISVSNIVSRKHKTIHLKIWPRVAIMSVSDYRSVLYYQRCYSLVKRMLTIGSKK
ncbi:hypothetical protein D3C72_700820 [compost metagenome]